MARMFQLPTSSLLVDPQKPVTPTQTGRSRRAAMIDLRRDHASAVLCNSSRNRRVPGELVGDRRPDSRSACWRRFHEIGEGGKLGIHADFRINDQLHLHRRLNVIIYLNEGWKPEWGGSLELWDRQVKAKHDEALSLFNRCVNFNTDADSFHGHLDELATPEGVFRRPIALYYCTASKDIYKQVPSTSTIDHARPGVDAATQREARRLRFDQHVQQ